EAAESVGYTWLKPFTALLHTNLLPREQPPLDASRFRMLDTVREYALEVDGDDVRDRHAHYYADLAERIGAELVGPHRIAAVRELVAEHENLPAALAHSREGDAEVGFRIA